MWRPEGWEDLRKGDGSKSDKQVFEDGANAILEALRKDGWRVTGEDIIPARGKYPEIHLPNTGMVGYLVFIPDEEESNV